jgi:hypothetical protein
MADAAALADIERRIQVVEDNLRQLIEQAAAYSGAADEERKRGAQRRPHRRSAGEARRAAQGARGAIEQELEASLTPHSISGLNNPLRLMILPETMNTPSPL